MKRFAMYSLAAAGLALTLGGCTSSQSRFTWSPSEDIALAMLAPVEQQPSLEPGEFRLGAGDTLGRAVYHNYVSIVRANPDVQFAGVETTGN